MERGIIARGGYTFLHGGVTVLNIINLAKYSFFMVYSDIGYILNDIDISVKSISTSTTWIFCRHPTIFIKIRGSAISY